MLGRRKPGWTGEALRSLLNLSVQSGDSNQSNHLLPPVSTHTQRETNTHTQPPTMREKKKKSAIPQKVTKCLRGQNTSLPKNQTFSP